MPDLSLHKMHRTYHIMIVVGDTNQSRKRVVVVSDFKTANSCHHVIVLEKNKIANAVRFFGQSTNCVNEVIQCYNCELKLFSI